MSPYNELVSAIDTPFSESNSQLFLDFEQTDPSCSITRFTGACSLS